MEKKKKYATVRTTITIKHGIILLVKVQTTDLFVIPTVSILKHI